MLCLHWHHNQTHSEYEKPANNDMHAIISAVKSHGKNSAKQQQQQQQRLGLLGSAAGT